MASNRTNKKREREKEIYRRQQKKQEITKKRNKFQRINSMLFTNF